MERWTKVLEEWQSSGLSQREFATQRGLRVKTVQWWHWKLGSVAKKEDSAPKVPARVPVFVPMELTPPAPPKALRLRIDHLPVTLEMDAGVDLGWVRAVVAALC